MSAFGTSQSTEQRPPWVDFCRSPAARTTINYRPSRSACELKIYVFSGDKTREAQDARRPAKRTSEKIQYCGCLAPRRPAHPEAGQGGDACAPACGASPAGRPPIRAGVKEGSGEARWMSNAAYAALVSAEFNRHSIIRRAPARAATGAPSALCFRSARRARSSRIALPARPAMAPSTQPSMK